MERIIQHRKSMAKAVGVPVIQYNKNNEYMKTYESIAEAARQNNINKKGISNVLHGQAKSAGGFYWKKYYTCSK
jgi:hypothetical protein